MYPLLSQLVDELVLVGEDEGMAAISLLSWGNKLVTGGAGFIGSRLVHALIKRDAAREILVFDNLHPQVHGNHPKRHSWGNQVRLFQGDVRDRDGLLRAIAEINPDTVYHLAAETGTAQSKECMARYCEVNVTGTANLLEALRLQARQRFGKMARMDSGRSRPYKRAFR